MPLATGCGHVAVVTEDLDRLVDFYVRVFDAEVGLDMDEGEVRHALIELGGMALHAFVFAGGHPSARGHADTFSGGHLDHVAIAVEDQDAFDEIRRRLVDVGASDGALTDFGPIRSVWFLDPDGMGAEITITGDGPPLAFADRRQEPF